MADLTAGISAKEFVMAKLLFARVQRRTIDVAIPLTHRSHSFAQSLIKRIKDSPRCGVIPVLLSTITAVCDNFHSQPPTSCFGKLSSLLSPILPSPSSFFVPLAAGGSNQSRRHILVCFAQPSLLVSPLPTVLRSLKVSQYCNEEVMLHCMQLGGWIVHDVVIYQPSMLTVLCDSGWRWSYADRCLGSMGSILPR
jgi:hypothetical protein